MWFFAFFVGVFVLILTLKNKRFNCYGHEINYNKEPLTFIIVIIGLIIGIVRCFLFWLENFI